MSSIIIVLKIIRTFIFSLVPVYTDKDQMMLLCGEEDLRKMVFIPLYALINIFGLTCSSLLIKAACRPEWLIINDLNSTD